VSSFPATFCMYPGERWGKRGARVNTISPGIIITPLANDELKGPRGPGYRRMLEVSAAGRAGTPDEVGTVGALLMGPDGAFITGSDFLYGWRCNGGLLVR
jgi:NAD(P)-dependent dehydrogenase (short-subunit alcohol dehydrogenase family)